MQKSRKLSALLASLSLSLSTVVHPSVAEEHQKRPYQASDIALDDLISDMSSPFNVRQAGDPGLRTGMMEAPKISEGIVREVNPVVGMRDHFRHNLVMQLIDRIVWMGCSVAARNEAASIILEMTRYIPLAILKNMLSDRVLVVIVPKGHELRDMPQTVLMPKNFPWANYAGVSNIKTKEGDRALLVPEEDLLGAHNFKTNNPSRQILVHEFGHAIQFSGLLSFAFGGKGYDLSALDQPIEVSYFGAIKGINDAERGIENRSIHHAAGLGPGGAADSGQSSEKFAELFPDRNSSTSSFEFFGTMTAVWFGVQNEISPAGHSCADEMRAGSWEAKCIRTASQSMYDALFKIYGPPRILRPLAGD